MTHEGNGDLADDTLRKLRVSFIQRAFLNSGTTAEEELLTLDLGLGGVFVERSQPLPLGLAVEVRFQLPGNEIPVEARCQVAWQAERGLGLEFLEMTPADRERVRDHLAQHLRRHPRARQFARPWPSTDRSA